MRNKEFGDQNERQKMNINTISGVCHLTNKLIVIINGALTKDTNWANQWQPGMHFCLKGGLLRSANEAR